MKKFKLKDGAKDIREHGQIILAHGEVTGHSHQVVGLETDIASMPPAQYFEEPDGRRVLLVDRPCQLVHQEHGTIALDPANPVQVRQGDVLLQPIGQGAWQCVRQSEFDASEIRQVMD